VINFWEGEIMEEQELMDLMSSRGYFHSMTMNPKKENQKDIFFNPNLQIHCEVPIGTKDFELSAIYRMFQIKSGKCSPIDSGEHFEKFEKQLWRILFRLND
jgi:hypothetical protein